MLELQLFIIQNKLDEFHLQLMKLNADASETASNDGEVLPEVLQAACSQLSRVQQLAELRAKQLIKVKILLSLTIMTPKIVTHIQFFALEKILFECQLSHMICGILPINIIDTFDDESSRISENFTIMRLYCIYYNAHTIVVNFKILLDKAGVT